MTENGNGRKAPPHHRMTFADVIRDYRDGLITVKGAIFYGLSSRQPQGSTVRMNPRETARQLGVGKSIIYKSISELKVLHRIDFETSGNLEVKVPVEENTGIPEYIFLDELSTKVESESRADAYVS